jgi:hypothetical protein
MNRLFLLTIIGALLLTACKDSDRSEQGKEPETPENKQLGCITGKITIFNTGSVTDAYVRLSLSREGEALYSGKIGSNGDYTIDNVKEGTYFLNVYKPGFVDTLFNKAISIQSKALNGDYCRPMDWAITKLPPSLYIVEVGTEKKINTLDFGISGNRLYFQIYNNSTNTYKWCTDFEEVKLDHEWLGTMTPIRGSLSPNDNPEIITLTIDRTKLQSGQPSSTQFLIKSDKSGGGVLTIIATAP